MRWTSNCKININLSTFWEHFTLSVLTYTGFCDNSEMFCQICAKLVWFEQPGKLLWILGKIMMKNTMISSFFQFSAFFCVHLGYKCTSCITHQKQGTKKLDLCNLPSILTFFCPSQELDSFSYKLKIVNSDFPFKFQKGKLPLQRY